MSKEKHEQGDKQVKIVHDLLPPEWDNGPLSLAHEIRNLLKSVVDENTGIDSGGGDGMADLWATVGGVEYFITIKRSRATELPNGERANG
jgi:hypothetical protein